MVYIYDCVILDREDDEYLQWPLLCSVRAQILNQSDPSAHYLLTFQKINGQFQRKQFETHQEWSCGVSCFKTSVNLYLSKHFVMFHHVASVMIICIPFV